MKIRTASIKDIENILPVRREIQEYHYHLDKVYESKVDLMESFRAHTQSFINSKSCIVFVAEENNELIGYALGQLKVPHPLFNIPKAGEVDDIGVRAKHRNHGAGEKLFKELVKWFKANGAERIDLKVHDNNIPAKNFWAKMGFNRFLIGMYKEIE